MLVMVEADRTALPIRLANGFPNCSDTWLHGQNDDVLDDPMP